MAEARRERITVAIVAALAAGCAPATVERNRRTSIDASEAPAIVVYDLGHEASYADVGCVNYTMQVDIKGVVTGTDETIGTVINDLYAKMMLSLAEYTLGGLCIGVREGGLDQDVATDEESSTSLATFVVSMAVDFQTPDGDPTG